MTAIGKGFHRFATAIPGFIRESSRHKNIEYLTPAPSGGRQQDLPALFLLPEVGARYVHGQRAAHAVPGG